MAEGIKTYEDRIDVVELHDDGWTMREIAAFFRVSHQRVCQVMKFETHRLDQKALSARRLAASTPPDRMIPGAGPGLEPVGVGVQRCPIQEWVSYPRIARTPRSR